MKVIHPFHGAICKVSMLKHQCKYFLSEKMISVMFANLAGFLSVQLWSTRFVVQIQETCTG